MKLIFAICVGVILSGLVYGQTGNDPERVIRRIVDAGLLDGHDRKVIGPLGDAGAVLVTRVLAGRDLAPQTIDNALVVIGGSFADPTFVEAASDREPRTALLLLKYFDLSTNDTSLKKRIAETLKYVQDRYSASLRAPDGKTP